MDKKLKLTFMPGCFDSFEGSQEELDQLIEEIKAGFESGELLENSTQVDLNDLMEEDDDVTKQLFSIIDESSDRKLQ
jgi:hypothetical protein